jgi:hypothetical protein
MLWGPRNLQPQTSITLAYYDRHNFSALTAQSSGTLLPYELVSRHLIKCWVQKLYAFSSHSKTMGFGTYDHITSQMVPSPKSLGSYCCRRNRIRYTIILTSSILQSACFQHILEGLIYSLSLSIGLTVISRTEVQLGIQGFMQAHPELQNKLGPFSGHNPLGHSMRTDYPTAIQLC